MSDHAEDCASFDFDPEKQLGPDKSCNCKVAADLDAVITRLQKAVEFPVELHGDLDALPRPTVTTMVTSPAWRVKLDADMKRFDDRVRERDRQRVSLDSGRTYSPPMLLDAAGDEIRQWMHATGQVPQAMPTPGTVVYVCRRALTALPIMGGKGMLDWTTPALPPVRISIVDGNDVDEPIEPEDRRGW